MFGFHYIFKKMLCVLTWTLVQLALLMTASFAG